MFGPLPRCPIGLSVGSVPTVTAAKPKINRCKEPSPHGECHLSKPSRNESVTSVLCCALSQTQPPAMDDAIQVRCSATSYGRRHPGALRMRVSNQKTKRCQIGQKDAKAETCSLKTVAGTAWCSHQLWTTPSRCAAQPPAMDDAIQVRWV